MKGKPEAACGSGPADNTASRLQVLGRALLFVLAAVGGEWIVHQLQYLIEYGSRFGIEMSSSPHRLYMAPLGGLLALAAVAVLALVALTLQWQDRRRWALLTRLPGRLRPVARINRPNVSLRQVGLIAVALLCCQAALYFTQENWEAAVRGFPLPWLAVLLSSGHWTVLPLHALLALSNAIILATLTAWLAGSRRALRLVEALVRLMTGGAVALPTLGPGAIHLPCLRLTAGRLGLRSPPAA